MQENRKEGAPMSWFHLPSCSEGRRAFGKKCLKRLGLALLVVCLLILLALEIISRGAAQIFNYAMANQDMLRGTITVERLISDGPRLLHRPRVEGPRGQSHPRDPERRLPRQRLGRPNARLQVDDDTRAHRQSALRIRPPLRQHEGRLRAPLARHGPPQEGV